MVFAISAHINVDLSALGGTKALVPGKLTYDDLGVPSEVEFEFPGANVDIINKLLAGNFGNEILKQRLTIATHQRQRITTSLESINHVGFGEGNTIIIRGHVGNSETTDLDKGASAPARWSLNLANFKLNHGDEWVQYPPPPGRANVIHGPRSLSRIRFSAGGREWILTDELFRFWKSNPNPNVPVESGTLTTAYLHDDTAAAIAAISGDIEMILTLALGRKVRFVSLAKVDANGDLIEASSRAGFVEPFNIGGGPPVDNWSGGVLRSLIEGAQPIVAANRDWWYETLGYYWQAHSNKYVQIKTAILNILIDRISTELTKAQGGAEIDDELPKRAGAEEFKKALHQLLMTLSTNWTEQRTADIIRTIKDYNARPPFPKKVARACAQQQLPPMAGKLLGTRHLLLHVGKLEPPDGDVIGYWMELDALVLMLILRMLRYEGQVYHPKYGADGIVLKDKLVAAVADVSVAGPVSSR